MHNTLWLQGTRCCPMVTVQVNDHDWSLVLKYWRDLQEHLNQPGDQDKIDFLNKIIFKSAGLNRFDPKSSETTEREIKTDDEEISIDSKLKTFIVEPV